MKLNKMWAFDMALKLDESFLRRVVSYVLCNKTIVSVGTNPRYIIVSIHATCCDLYNARRVFYINDDITS